MTEQQRDELAAAIVTERQVRIQMQTLRDYGLPHSAAMLESLMAERDAQARRVADLERELAAARDALLAIRRRVDSGGSYNMGLDIVSLADAALGAAQE